MYLLRCPVCGREYRTAFGLKIHFRRRHDLRFCTFCRRRFRNSEGLKRHSAWKARREDDPNHGVVFYLLSESSRVRLETKLRRRVLELLRKGFRMTAEGDGFEG
jgi:hypothetical protein